VQREWEVDTGGSCSLCLIHPVWSTSLCRLRSW